VNNDERYFPRATASSSHPLAPPFYAVDGNRWYHPSPPNRWVAAPSPEGTDWFEVDFGAERRVREVTLYFLDDARGPRIDATGEVEGSGFPDATQRPELSGSTGPTVRPPASYDVQRWDGSAWVEVPGQTRTPSEPAGRRANRVTFPEVATTAIRVVLRHQAGATSGLTEIEAWSADPLPLSEPEGAPEPPRVRASFTGQTDRVEQAVDGRLSFTRYSRNRWTAYGSPNAADWLEVDFGAPRAIGRVELYFYGDGRGVAAPAAYRIETWDGAGWVAVAESARTPETPAAWALNTVELEPVEASRLRVTFTHDGAMRSGLTELRVSPPGEG
jgi:hypothetical protein